MPSGVYALGISAKDAYGNHAIDATGNDGPIFTTVTLERASGSNKGTTTVADTTPPTILTMSPANGSTVTNAVSTVTVQFTDPDSAINIAGTGFSMRDPNNAVITGTISNNGTDTILVTFNPVLQTNGTYTMTIAPIDTNGNTASYTRTFNINIGLNNTSFESSIVLYPNPAKNTNATISYTLGTAAIVNVDIFNIMGERVFSTSFNDPQGVNLHTWNLMNDSGMKVGSGLYLVRLQAAGGGQNVKSVRKLVVIQ
jgi:hypothetical protein